MNNTNSLLAYRKTEKELEKFSPKQKAKKILKHLKNIEPKDQEEQQTIDNELIIIEELDPQVIESHLDELNKIIMGNARKTLNLDKD